ncbi:MAG: hypothetical protein AAGA48_01295 [Myxococcota bacterium]
MYATDIRSWALLLLVTACRAPPEAPAEFEALSAFLFEDLGTDEQQGLEAGVENLAAWLEANLDEANEGYTIELLSQASLDALEVQRERDAAKLVGGAVTTLSQASVLDLASAFLLEDQTTIYPDDYVRWDSNFRSDPNCFVSRECDELVVDNDTVTRLPLSLELTTKNTAQYRWVETEAGPAMLTRSWLREPADVNLNIFRVDDQFFLSANVPTSRGLVRLQSVWVDAAIVGVEVPEATALNLLIDGLVAQDEALYAWLAR